MLVIKHNPSKRELIWFGSLFAVFTGAFGSMVYWKWGSITGAYIAWTVGTLVTILFFAVPPARRYIYLGWMYMVFPISWLVTHIMMGFVYYLVFTPVALIMKIIGRDPMTRSFDNEASSYWVEHRTGDGPTGRYFKQF